MVTDEVGISLFDGVRCLHGIDFGIVGVHLNLTVLIVIEAG